MQVHFSARTRRAVPNPALTAVDALARDVSSYRWFSRVGLTPEIDRFALNGSVGAMAVNPLRLLPVSSWTQARKFIEQPRPGTLDLDEEVTKASEALEARDRDFPTHLIRSIVEELSHDIAASAGGEAASAAMRAGVADGAVVRMAGDSAGKLFKIAAYGVAAGQPRRWAQSDLTLFAAGHWPVSRLAEEDAVYLF